MHRLFRTNSTASTSSRSTLETNLNIVNEEQKLEFQTDDSVDFWRLEYPQGF